MTCAIVTCIGTVPAMMNMERTIATTRLATPSVARLALKRI